MAYNAASTTTLTLDLDADLVRRAYMAASTEETRYYLNGVHVEPLAAGGVVIVATDGAMLLAFHDPSGAASEALTLTLTKETLRKCVDSSKGKARLLAADGRVTVILPERGAEYGARRVEAQEVASQPLAVLDCPFAHWRGVLPIHADLKPVQGVAVDAGKLATLAKALSGERGGAPVQLFSAAPGESSPYWVQGSGFVDGFGVLMPLRGDAVPLRATAWLA